MRDIMKNTPGWVVAICGTVAFVTVVGAFVFLSATQADATAFQGFLNTILNLAGAILGGGAFLAAGAAAKQTNGQLKPRIKEAVGEVIDEKMNGGADDGRQTV